MRGNYNVLRVLFSPQLLSLASHEQSTMSARGIVPLALAVGFGIANGQ